MNFTVTVHLLAITYVLNTTHPSTTDSTIKRKEGGNMAEYVSIRAPTCKVLIALAGEASLPAATHTVGTTWFRVAEVNLSLTVVSCEAGGTAATQPGNGVDGSEQYGIRRNKRGQAVKLQHRDTLHVVLTWLS